MIPLADLRPWETNYRHHPAEQLGRIRESLRRARWEHADAVPKSQPHMEPDEFIAEMHRRGLGYTISPQPGDELPGERLNMPFEKARKKRAIAMGIEQEIAHQATG